MAALKKEAFGVPSIIIEGTKRQEPFFFGNWFTFWRIARYYQLLAPARHFLRLAQEGECGDLGVQDKTKGVIQA